MISIWMEAAKGILYRPAWQKKLICELSTPLVVISILTQPYSTVYVIAKIPTVNTVSAENHNSKINIKWKGKIYLLKGQCHKIFWFFSCIILPQAPEYNIRVIWIVFKIFIRK
jgi:hypothetical protein